MPEERVTHTPETDAMLEGSDDLDFDSPDPIEPDAETEAEDVSTETEEVAQTPDDGEYQPETETPAEAEPPKAEVEPQWATELREQTRRAVETFSNAANRFRNNPTEQNHKAAEKAKSKLDDLLEQDDLDIDAAKGIKALAGEVKQRSESSEKSNEELRQLQEQLASQQAQTARFVQEYQFDRANPELVGKYVELSQKATDLAVERFGPNFSNDAFALIAERVIEEAKATATPRTEPETPAKSASPKLSTQVKTPKTTQPHKAGSQPAKRVDDGVNQDLYDRISAKLTGSYD